MCVSIPLEQGWVFNVCLRAMVEQFEVAIPLEQGRFFNVMLI